MKKVQFLLFAEVSAVVLDLMLLFQFLRGQWKVRFAIGCWMFNCSDIFLLKICFHVSHFFFLLFSTQQEETSSKFSTLKAVCVPEPFSSLCLWMRYSLHIWLICHFHHWQLAVFGWRLINYFFPLSKVKTLEMQKKVVLCHFWTGKAL